jgi:hypothetical protein
MSALETYTGSCHCGRVRYRAEVDLTQPVMACNCTMCGRTGTLLTFVPSSRFELQSGEDVLTDYQFNKHNIHHVFCRICGVKSFARGTARDGASMVAINARCLEGVDPDTLQIKHNDGRSY